MHKDAIFIYGIAKGGKLPLTMKAVTYAHRWHKGQKRINGADYIVHPLAVCRTLINHGVRDDATLAASLLHDVKEDRGITHEELVKEFGIEVANLVDRTTKKSGMSMADSCLIVAEDIKAIIIKAADRAHNIGDMVGAFSINKLESYADETEKDILPMMKEARRIYLDYSDALVSLRDQIVNVIKVVRALVEASRENHVLKLENEELKEKIRQLEIK